MTKLSLNFVIAWMKKGIFRKLIAFIIATRLFHRGIFFGQQWMLKSNENNVTNEQTLREE